VRARVPIILTVVLLSISASAARADTWCVNTTGCDPAHDKGSDLAAGLLAAKNNPGVDTVKVGGGAYPTTTGFTYNFPDPVHIEGSGGRDVGPASAPTLTNGANNLSGVTMLTVQGSSASTISGIDVELPGGNGSGNSGIDTTGAVGNVLVQTQAGQPPSDSATGVRLRAGAAFTRSDVFLELGLSSTGVEIAGPSTTVADARIQANAGISSGTGGNSASVKRARIDYGNFGVELKAGDATADDSLLVGHPEAGNPIALSVIIAAGSSSLIANHVTLIGPAASSVALDVVNGGSGSASIAFHNSVSSGFESQFQRVASGSGPADISTLHSNYGFGTAADSGPGSISQVNTIFGSPGFLGATDYHLRPDSVLIDSADPAETTGGGSSMDLDGEPRLVDGNGDCTANRDIGAYEFQPGPRAPRTFAAAGTPATAVTGQLVTFNSSDTCDPDGDALTYSWRFDDGGGAPGASVQRTFLTPGVHFGTLTVTDTTGLTSTATATVFVAYPPFPGVAVRHGKVRASRRGAVKLDVSCPATTAGRCAGTLTLDGARSTFSIPAGASKPVKVKLSKAKLKTLRRRRRQTFTARVVAHDANGTSRTSTARLTLLAPR
jgi:PKD domain